LVGDLEDLAASQMLEPNLGREPQLLPGYPAAPERVPDFGFIAVHLGGVDMPVAERERLLDGPAARIPAHLPRTQTERGDPGSL
jgi:hypothetical protein